MSRVAPLPVPPSCPGIGEVHEIDPTLLRLILVFLALACVLVPLLITYIVGWMIIPQEGE